MWISGKKRSMTRGDRKERRNKNEESHKPRKEERKVMTNRGKININN